MGRASAFHLGKHWLKYSVDVVPGFWTQLFLTFLLSPDVS